MAKSLPEKLPIQPALHLQDALKRGQDRMVDGKFCGPWAELLTVPLRTSRTKSPKPFFASEGMIAIHLQRSPFSTVFSPKSRRFFGRSFRLLSLPFISESSRVHVASPYHDVYIWRTISNNCWKLDSESGVEWIGWIWVSLPCYPHE